MSAALNALSDDELNALYRRATELYDNFRQRGLSLNMARGKPSPEQLDLSEELLALPGSGDHTSDDGIDCRNYGGGQGLPEARALYAPLVGSTPDNTMVADNASLALMHDHVVFSLLKGNPDSPAPWSAAGPVKFVCPVPGYDRHFSIAEQYGIEMVAVELHDDGPDMDQVEALLKDDPAIKGMWCVPKYSNPSGAVYSDRVIRRLAAMPAAAPDFRIFWDNAYAVHHLTPKRVEIANLIEACAAAGHPNRALAFASTSKITFAGAGLGIFGSSEANVRWYLDLSGKRCIGPDKVNQLRHMRLLPDAAALAAHMARHREIIAPKFDAVHDVFERLLTQPAIASWTRPKGGYFISLNVPDGCARRAIEVAGEAGVTMTPAGAAFPYGEDPHDRNIRVAPTFPGLDEVRQAAEGIACSVLLAATEIERSARGEVA